MKKLLTILFSFICLTSFSQMEDSVVTVKGLVWDFDYEEDVPFANIYGVKVNDGKQKVMLAQTDFNGKFKFKLNKFIFDDTLIVSYLGIEKKFHYNSFKIISIEGSEKLLNGLILEQHKIYTAEEILDAPIRSKSRCFENNKEKKSKKKNLIDVSKTSTGSTYNASTGMMESIK